MDEALVVRLSRLDRNLDWLRRIEALVWKIIIRVVRVHRVVRVQLITSAQTPPPREAHALGSKLFAELIDEVTDRPAGKPAKTTSDPAITQLRSLQ